MTRLQEKMPAEGCRWQVREKNRFVHIVLVLFLACAGLSVFIPANWLPVMVFVLSAILILQKNGHLAFPVMIFYYNYFGEIAGIRTFYIYAVLLIGFCLITGVRYQPKKLWSIWVGAVYTLYLLLVLFPLQPKSAILYFISLATVITLKRGYLEDPEKLKAFFRVYVITAVIAYFTGMVSDNVYESSLLLNEVSTDVARMMSTFDDPNYMGLFYTVAIFALATLELFSAKIRWVLVAVLYIMVASSLSLTAVVGNVVFWFIYLGISRKMNVRTVIIILAVALVMILAYQYGLTHPDVGFIGNLSARISDKLASLSTGNIAATTTGRTRHLSEHLAYFASQTPMKMLFGGNAMNNIVMDSSIDTYLAHSEYADLLLNVGIIGAAILLGYILRDTLTALKRCRRNPSDHISVCIFTIKVIYLFYAATLTMFLESRFLLFYFI